MIWQSLLKQALRVIDNAFINIDPRQWRFGGGTVLMIRYDHRSSKDIDLFFSDPQLIDYLSPTRNDALEDVMGDYVDGHLFKRYVLDEGKIDFVRGHPVTELPPESFSFEGRKIYTDSSVEIVAKKIFYRCDEFKARDAFDLAVVLQHGGKADLMNFCAEHQQKVEIARTQFMAMRDDGSLEFGLNALDVLQGGKEALAATPSLVTKFFDQALL